MLGEKTFRSGVMEYIQLAWKFMQLAWKYFNYFFCMGKEMNATFKEIKMFLGLITILLGILLNLTVPAIVDYVIDFMPEKLRMSESFNAYFLAFTYFIANVLFLRFVFANFCEEKSTGNVEELKDRIYELEQEKKVLNTLVEKQQERIKKLKSKLKDS
ncbi:MAG: hypothetical protein GXO22_07395 [Aquificae bacterium]|nr:hypothetical protein [Aquificota bacterium]